MRDAIEARAGTERTHAIAATRLATALLGDSIATNLFLLGFAWQRGSVPLERASLLQAIGLNGVAVAMNQQAFEWGRRAAVDLAKVEAACTPETAVAPHFCALAAANGLTW